MKLTTVAIIFAWAFLACATILLLAFNRHFNAVLLTLSAWAGGIVTYNLYLVVRDRDNTPL